MAFSGLSKMFLSPINVEDYDSHLDRELERIQSRADANLLQASLLESELNFPRYSSLRRRIGASPLSYRINDTKKDKFKVMLNVNQFKPYEVDVKVVDNYLVIHGKHPARSDEHGFVEREFTRRYLLPEDVEGETVKSSLSKDGLLAVEASKKAALPVTNERVVPIIVEMPQMLEKPITR